MAYELTGIFRHCLKDMDVMSAYVCVHDALAITNANGTTLDKSDILRALDKSYVADDDGTLANAYVYVQDTYTHIGNTHTNKAARKAFNRDRYSFYPVCVHVLNVKRFPVLKPIAVDM